jgi:REP element-mobilizing transposase RayT
VGYPHRLQADADYHVWTRSTKGIWLAETPDERRLFVRLFGSTVVRFGWKCHQYVVLGTHAHAAIRTPEANIGRGMQWLLGVYCRAVNRLRGRKGHLVGERYGSKTIESEEHALELCRYIPLNPVRAGLCDKPEVWPWSSYAALVGRAIRPPWLDPTWVHDQFGRDPLRAIASLEIHVREGMAAPPVELDYLRGT